MRRRLSPSTPHRYESVPPLPLSDLILLTRRDCVNTPTMRLHLEEALRRLQISAAYLVIDVDTLGDGDLRRGYGTPTVLCGGRDLFGLPAPVPPLPTPT